MVPKVFEPMKFYCIQDKQAAMMTKLTLYHHDPEYLCTSVIPVTDSYNFNSGKPGNLLENILANSTGPDQTRNYVNPD